MLGASQLSNDALPNAAGPSKELTSDGAPGSARLEDWLSVAADEFCSQEGLPDGLACFSQEETSNFMAVLDSDFTQLEKENCVKQSRRPEV